MCEVFFCSPEKCLLHIQPFLLLMKVLLLIEKHQGKEIECVSLPLTTPPCGASSPSKVVEQADATVCRERALQRWTTVWRGTRRTQGAISLRLGRHGSPCPFQGGHPFSPSVHWLHSAAQRRVELFLPFSGKELSRGTQDQQLLFTEVLAVTCPCIGHGRKNQTLLPHLWENAGSNLPFGILHCGSLTLGSK